MTTSLWAEYARAHPEHAAEQPPVVAFGDSPTMADELLALVLAGTKRATAGLVATYEQDGEPLPADGDHWVVTDSTGAERAVLRSVEVRVGRLDSVDEQFARDEGEGDLTLRWWLEAHRAYVSREVERRGIEAPDGIDALDVLFERFVVVWPPEAVD